MDRVATYPAIAASKARSLELLAGCGRVSSTSAAASATTCGPWARAPSASIRAARCSPRRGARRRRRSSSPTVSASRSGRGAFDGARADRVLQHVAEPERGDGRAGARP